MKKMMIFSAALTVCAIVLAVILALGNPLVSTDVPASPGAASPSAPQSTGPYLDNEVTVRVLFGEELRELSMRDYLIGVVAAEMPAQFELEALKAQAVAARTDTLYSMTVVPNPRHPQADMCADSACCEAYLDETQLRGKWGAQFEMNLARIADAVGATDGRYLTYDGQPIFAAFHSSSAGLTEDSANVWGGALPYLVSVESPESEADVPNYVSTVTVAFSDFIETAAALYPEMVFGEDKTQWISDLTYTTSGRISALTLGGVRIRGVELRTAFGLRSASVRIDITGEAVVFTTTGYGHGVGMSQYGANTYAAAGKRFEEILSAYYPGTVLASDAGIGEGPPAGTDGGESQPL